MRGLLEPGRRWLVVALGGALAIAVPTVVALVLAGPAASPPPETAAPSAGSGPGCGRGPGAPALCGRAAQDTAARSPLTADQRAAAQERLPEVRSVVDRAGCGQACRQPESPQEDTGPPSSLDLELARRALVAAGFDEVTVRSARGDDPAPPGATIYSVAVGPACILVYQVDVRSQGTESIVGRRPDGHCLAP